jgi:amino acid transporter
LDVSVAAADSTWLTAMVGVLWLMAITPITIYGIRWTVSAQWVFLIVPYVALLGTSIWGIVRVAFAHPTGLPISTGPG